MLGAREINDIRNISIDEMNGEKDEDCLRPHQEAYLDFKQKRDQVLTEDLMDEILAVKQYLQ